MKKIACFFMSVLFLTACNEEKKKDADMVEQKTENTFEMYEMSEMAALMEKMYTDHEAVKAQLENGELTSVFPEYLLKIHTAAFTDESDNDDVFKNWANLYIEYEKNIYTDKENAITHYNNAVNACIYCHQQKCTGPVPRIKKLLITK